MWIRGGGCKTLIHKMWIICLFLLLNRSLSGLREEGDEGDMVDKMDYVDREE